MTAAPPPSSSGTKTVREAVAAELLARGEFSSTGNNYPNALLAADEVIKIVLAHTTNAKLSSDGRTDEAKARESDQFVGALERAGAGDEPRTPRQAGVGSERSSPSETILDVAQAASEPVGWAPFNDEFGWDMSCAFRHKADAESTTNTRPRWTAQPLYAAPRPATPAYAAKEPADTEAVAKAMYDWQYGAGTWDASQSSMKDHYVGLAHAALSSMSSTEGK